MCILHCSIVRKCTYLFVRHRILRQRPQTKQLYRNSSAMSFGFSVSDITAISRLAFKVYTKYKDAPGDYRNISDEVKALHIIIDNAAEYFKIPTLSDNKRQEGQEVLRSCQNLLEDLDSLVGKYNGLASASKGTSSGQVLQKIKLGAGLVLGTEDIATLRVRLTSNIALLSTFIQRSDISTISIRY